MKVWKVVLVILLFSLCATATYAQKATATIRGTVSDKKTGEVIPGTVVYVKGTSIGVQTDMNGLFTIPRLSKGTYTLVASSIGYDTIAMEVTIIKDNQIVTQNMHLGKVDIQIGQVEVVGQRDARKTEKHDQVIVSKITITPELMNQIPSVGGEPDLAQFLTMVPGAIITGDQGGQLYIRGGSPVQTKVLLDGLTVYNPFHSIGLFSIFDNDVLKSVDIYTGGFNAEYGGRISAVLDVHTRDGNKKRVSGKIAGSPFIAKVELEGPLTKPKEDGSSLTYVLSSRNSFLDRTSPTLYKYVDGGSLPYAFNDFYGKLAFNSQNGSSARLFGFYNNDRASFLHLADFGWKQWGVGANFTVLPNGSTTQINGIVGYSRYDIAMKQADQQPRNSSISGFNVGLDFAYFVKAGELRYGFDVNGYGTNFNFFNTSGTITKLEQNSTELGVFLKFRKVIGKKLVLDPGIRFDYYASLGTISPEPRLGIKYNVTDWLRIKVASGLYAQNLISTKADKDVVDLFTGYLFAPDQTLKRPDGTDANYKLQKAVHTIFGVEIDVAKHWEVTIEPYYKKFLQLVNLNRYKQFVSESDFLLETGDAYGIDFLVKYNYHNVSVWVSYSLSKVRRYDGSQTYAPFYDRTHNLNTSASYKFGKHKWWNVSGRWNFGTGFPFTRTQSFYEDVSFLNGINTNYVNQNGSLGIQYEKQINGGRLPVYHRLDLSIEKHFGFTEQIGMDITLSATNVYDRQNIFYFDRVRYVRVNQLPVLPSLALSLSF